MTFKKWWNSTFLMLNIKTYMTMDVHVRIRRVSNTMVSIGCTNYYIKRTTDGQVWLRKKSAQKANFKHCSVKSYAVHFLEDIMNDLFEILYKKRIYWTVISYDRSQPNKSISSPRVHYMRVTLSIKRNISYRHKWKKLLLQVN